MPVTSSCRGGGNETTTKTPRWPLRPSSGIRVAKNSSGRSWFDIWPRKKQERQTCFYFTAFASKTSTMRVLLDTDMFCKLAAVDLLVPSLEVVGSSLSDCSVLPSLPSKLLRGKLVVDLGLTECQRLLPLARQLRAIPDGDPARLDQFLAWGIKLDPGEAQIFAVGSADQTSLVFTGDKRAMAEAGRVPELVQLLGSRVVSLEAAIIALIQDRGVDHVVAKLTSKGQTDMMLRVCCASCDPLDCFRRYLTEIHMRVGSGLLWGHA